MTARLLHRPDADRRGFAACFHTSSVVGYQEIETDYDVAGTPTHAKNPMRGFTFVPVSGAAVYALGDVKPTNFNAVDGEYLYQLAPASARPADGQYIYLDLANAKIALDTEDDEEAGALVGWWLNAVTGDDEDRCDTATFAVGSAFLGDFSQAANVSFTCAGAVPSTNINVNISGKVYPMFANPIPKQITFGDVTIGNMMAVDGEFFYQLQPTNARPADGQYIYLDLANAKIALDTEDDEEAGALVGWWLNAVTGDDEDRCDTLPIKAGEAFIGSMGGNANVVVSFPRGI